MYYGFESELQKHWKNHTVVTDEMVMDLKEELS